MKADKLVIGLVGMPGSGKSIVVETAQAKRLRASSSWATSSGKKHENADWS